MEKSEQSWQDDQTTGEQWQTKQGQKSGASLPATNGHIAHAVGKQYWQRPLTRHRCRRTCCSGGSNAWQSPTCSTCTIKRFFQIIAKTTHIATEENRLENSVGQFWQSFGKLNESRLGSNGQTERTHAVLATSDLLTLNRSGWQWCCLWIAHCCWSNESMGCTTKLLIEWRWVCMPCHTTANKDV